MTPRTVQLYAFVLILAATVLVPSRSRGGDREVAAPGMESDLRYFLRQSDEASIALLEGNGIMNDREWRSHFSGQVMGFGVRTPRRELRQDDLSRIVEILLDNSAYTGGTKSCLTMGDAAVFLRSPIGEVLIMFELWCGRVHFRNQTGRCLSFMGNIDRDTPELIRLVARYFPDDQYLKENLGFRERRPPK